MRVFATCVLLALTFGVVNSAEGVEKDLRAFKRPRHSYDSLPTSAAKLAAESTAVRRVATALDTKRRAYFVYVALMRDGRVCTILVQANGYTARCVPSPLLFTTGRRTTAVVNGLIGGVAANGVTKIVLQGGPRRKQLPLTSDNGFIFGCPAPSTCASWVKTVLGYNAAGKLVSRQTVA